MFVAEVGVRLARSVRFLVAVTFTTGFAFASGASTDAVSVAGATSAEAEAEPPFEQQDLAAPFEQQALPSAPFAQALAGAASAGATSDTATALAASETEVVEAEPSAFLEQQDLDAACGQVCAAAAPMPITNVMAKENNTFFILINVF